jgi:hypothetical protein
MPWGRALAHGFAVTAAATLWLQVLHHAAGAAEEGEPPLLVHWLRDGTLALPLLVGAALSGLVLARSLAGGDRGLLARAVAATSVAGLCATTLVGGAPLHGALFEASHPEELAPLVHATRDALLALAAALPAAAAVEWLASRPTPRGALRLVRTPVAAGGAAVGAVVAPAAVLVAALGGGAGDAVTAAAAPCPASAPVRAVHLRAVEVAPVQGDEQRRMMLVRAATEAQARRAAAQRGSLTLRARAGECLDVAFTNALRGRSQQLHIEGLPFRGGTSGPVKPGATRRYRYAVPAGLGYVGTYKISPGLAASGTASERAGLFGFLDVEP